MELGLLLLDIGAGKGRGAELLNGGLSLRAYVGMEGGGGRDYWATGTRQSQFQENYVPLEKRNVK